MTPEEYDRFIAVFLHGANNLLETLDRTSKALDETVNRINDQLNTITEGLDK